jgi:hypothetical protein
MVLQWCYNGVTMVLHGCHLELVPYARPGLHLQVTKVGIGVTVVLQWFYKGVTVVLQWF